MKLDQIVRLEKDLGQNETLEEDIAKLKLELDDVRKKIETFEALLRSQLSCELIAEQELSVLYKSQKSEKRAKRLAQKQKGKNYVETAGLNPQQHKPVAHIESADDLKEKKRLYREAMLHVHPDKFSMNDDKIDLATELTTRLIDIYKQEDLQSLKVFHAHLVSKTELAKNLTGSSKNIELTASPEAYLVKEKEQVKQALHELKNRHTYHVLTTYSDPSTFINELRVYYQDRIQKLRRRTRSK